MGRHDDAYHHRSKHSKRMEPRKERRRFSSSSSDNGATNTSAVGGFDRKLAEHRSKTREERKRERQLAKERETPEEKRQRRLVKKMLKEEKRQKANKAELPESIPYTNTNNPFNDNNLTDVFVWNKKLEADGNTKLSRKQIEKMSRERIHRNVAEMEELKRNREARQAMREDMEMMAREENFSQYSDWRRTEDAFHLNQAKLRSQIRIQEGRAKSIDLLARYITYGDEDMKEVGEFELKEPLTYLKGCSAEDYENLLADIKVYRIIDGKKNDFFWNDITTVVNGELKRIAHRLREESGNVPAFVESDILNIFKSKTYEQLEDLSAQIRSKITNAGRGTDVGYWETTLELLNPYMAKQRLKKLHGQKLALRLKRIREEHRRETAQHDRDAGLDAQPSDKFEPMEPNVVEKAENDEFFKPAAKSTTAQDDCETMEKKIRTKVVVPLPFTIDELAEWDEETREKKWQLLGSDQLEHLSLQLYAHGSYSPRYGDEAQAMPGIEILDEAEDHRRMEALRKKGGDAAASGVSEDHARMLAIAQQGMSSDETVFADEATLERQSFLWSDRYRPRKPRYFNRVHTGFDWNKYNQTHYDMDNPPPKIVQGYRFNIFYPDLLDASETLSFKLIECEDPDFAILRFKSGPPYEDIAFKIVNREWEVNHKHGYKCQFQNGVFQLWFFFKRYRYRR